MAGDDAAAQLGARLGAHGGRGGRERDEPVGESLGVARRERELERQAGEELLQRRVAREHRHLAGGGLVDDLVERLAAARLGRAEQRIGAGEQRRQLVAWERRLDPDAVAQLGRARPRPPPARARGRARRRSAAVRGSRAARRSRGGSPARAPRASCRNPSSAPCARGRAGAAARSCRSPAAGANCPTSIACPVAWSFGVSIGNEPRLTLITTSTSGSASRSDRLGFQCVYQSSIGIRSGFTNGAASSANNGIMWIRTALGRVARGSASAAKARLNRTPRPTRVRAPKVRRRTLPGRSWRPTASQRTSTASQRAASSRTRSTVWASTGWSASIFCVTKRIRTLNGRCRRSSRRPAPSSRARAPPASSASRRTAPALLRPSAPRARGRRGRGPERTRA